MMIGERNYPYPTFHVPPCITIDDSAAEIPYPYDMISNGDDCSPYEAVTALHRFLPSNDVGLDSDDLELYSSDHFRMFEFKVRKCSRGRSHDWTECPYAHPGEKARRRDPRKYHYSGTSCPDFRKGNCKKGDACEYAHGVFECWLHPARYRTQPCKDGPDCGRRVCFFAHSPDQLRVLSPRTPDSLESNGCSGAMRFSFMSSPESVSPPSESPPMSPMVNSVAASLRQLQLNKVKSMPSSWSGVQLSPNGYGPPRLGMTPPGFFSSPSTPTGAPGRIGIRPFDLCEEGPMMERVESGRDLRAKMFEKLSRENPLDRVDPDPQSACPDVKWVSDLLK